MHIRSASIKDADLLSTLCADVQKLHADAYPDIFKQPDDPLFASAHMAQGLAEPHVFALIAEVDGEGVGYVLCNISHREEHTFAYAWTMLYVDQMGVKPDYQRQGVGAALMDKVRDIAREHNIKRIMLNHWGFNNKAHAFYEKQGFETYNYRMWLNVD